MAIALRLRLRRAGTGRRVVARCLGIPAVPVSRGSRAVPGSRGIRAVPVSRGAGGRVIVVEMRVAVAFLVGRVRLSRA
ncbi:hypothetical protein AB0F81_46610 [Actinoplanes sp. NPDC024001]|uniref:hypothetical protein n=1 Tax=Actinoplanes sp. NPDC024001 TaxID=3154598 RepID=UPI0033F35ADB